MDYETLDSAITRLSAQADAATESGRGWNDVWRDIKSISEEFRAVRYPSGQDRNLAWERLQSVVAAVKTAQECQRQRAAGTRLSIEQRINDLRDLQRDAMNRRTPWKEFWSAASEIHSELQSAQEAIRSISDQIDQVETWLEEAREKAGG